MTLYNQNNYAHIPYPSSTLPKATVKSGGCGVCCSSTILSYFGIDCPPDKLASVFVNKKIRVVGGTDMKKAADYMTSIADLEYTTTSDENVLYEHLVSGGSAIANVGGDRTGHVGVFSSAGHYIVILGVKTNGDFLVHDVGYYSGKFNTAARKNKVISEGNIWSCTQKTLHEDTLSRSPSYYLFKRLKNKDKLSDEKNEEGEFGLVYKYLADIPDWGRATIEKLIEKGALQGEGGGVLNIPHEILRVYVINDRMGLYN